ncbi:MAG: glycosyltransferase family 39 protein [Bacteroidetes bacterium]|nr:glycosyltransferase family 39 protein [Bacteroidota bacterium]
MKFRLRIDIPENVKRTIGIFLFVIALAWFFNSIGLPATMSKRPCSIHLFGQTERASIALNYSERDMNFFLPRIHKFDHGDDGITGMEFPLVPYVPAICYKLFGFNEIYYRGFVLLIIVAGLFLFYQLVYSVTKSYVLSLGLIAAAYFSPALIFYSNNFMPDVPSLGFVLAGWYYFFKFLRNEQNKKYFRIYWLLMLLGILIKITSFISLTAVIGLVILDSMGFFKKTSERGFLFSKNQKRTIIVGYILTILLVAAWYLYARWLSNHYKNAGFLLSQTVETAWAEIVGIWSYINKVHKYEYFTYEGYVLFGSLFTVLLLGYKFVSRLYFTITILILIGNLIFICLFFSQFHDHEYYIIPLLPFIFMLVLTFGDFLQRVSLRFSRLIYFAFLVILFFNLKESAAACKKDFTLKYEPKYIRWVSDFESYWDLEPKLRKLGIKNTDYTLAGFDKSFCNSLYLMNQLGYSFDEKISKEDLKKLIENPRYKYLVISDSTKFNAFYPNSFSQNIVTTHRGLIVYKLR